MLGACVVSVVHTQADESEVMRAQSAEGIWGIALGLNETA